MNPIRGPMIGLTFGVFLIIGIAMIAKNHQDRFVSECRAAGKVVVYKWRWVECRNSTHLDDPGDHTK